ncbi:MAG: amidohydrolase [Bacillota bacterium]
MISWRNSFCLADFKDGCVVDMHDQTLYYNANIYTMDSRVPRASAVAIRGDRIVGLGTRAEAESTLSGPYDTVNVQGLTVVPGFTDCHIHFLWYALGLRRLNLDGVLSIGEVARRVSERATQARPGEWILGHGWNRSLWPEGDTPSRLQLDAVSPANPVVLTSKDGHTEWVNSLALAVAGIDRDTPDPDGGKIERDPYTGEPTGILRENAQGLVDRAIPTPDLCACESAIAEAIPQMHEFGVVGIHDCEDELAFRAFQNLASRGELGLRVLMMIPRSNLDAAIRLGLQTGLGDPTLRVGSLKVFADGALGSQTAALLEPYICNPDNMGITVTPKEELVEIITQASRAGIAVAVHAIGDRANRDVLDAFEKSASTLSASMLSRDAQTLFQESQPASRCATSMSAEHDAHMAGGTTRDSSSIGQRRLRHRIEHAQLVHPDDLRRFAALGIIASVQPVHATSDRYMADRHWGERASRGYAYRSLADAGARLAFGSDAPVEVPDPITGIFAAVTRKRADEVLMPGWHTEECLSVEQAVHGYTLGAAYASGEETIKGSISAGKLADFVVLSRDIFAIPPDEIIQIKVLTTVLAGQVVFDRVGLKG